MERARQIAGTPEQSLQVIDKQHIKTSLSVVGKEAAGRDFNDLETYHTHILKCLSTLKAGSIESSKLVCQEKFIGVAMQAISVYSLLFTNTIASIAASGLKNHAQMILTGASLLLGADAEGHFFQLAVAIADRGLKNSDPIYRLINSSKRKENYGSYISNIDEMLKELRSFCGDHPLYKNFIAQLLQHE